MNLYLIGLTTLRRLEIQFIPDNLKVSRRTNGESVAITGRNNPFNSYSSGQKELRFQLDFYSRNEDKRDVIDSCTWLESITYNDSYGKPPENVRLVFGQVFTRGEIWFVKSVDYDLSLFNKAVGLLPQQAYVDITLAIDNPKDYKRRDLV